MTHYDSWPLGHAKLSTTAIYTLVSPRLIQSVEGPLDKLKLKKFKPLRQPRQRAAAAKSAPQEKQRSSA